MKCLVGIRDKELPLNEDFISFVFPRKSLTAGCLYKVVDGDTELILDFESFQDFILSLDFVGDFNGDIVCIPNSIRLLFRDYLEPGDWATNTLRIVNIMNTVYRYGINWTIEDNLLYFINRINEFDAVRFHIIDSKSVSDVKNYILKCAIVDNLYLQYKDKEV